jgi:hypothetical protein
MELLESDGARPRQARYQAALRPDMKCIIDSRALSNFTATPVCCFSLDSVRTVPNTFPEASLCQNPFCSAVQVLDTGPRKRPRWLPENNCLWAWAGFR